jgi:hypothetical protein
VKLRIAVEIALVLVGVLVVAAVALILKFGYREVKGFFSGGPPKPEVGSCLGAGTGTERMKLVDCAAPEAAHKVVGVVDGKTRAETNQACQDFGTADSFLFLWEGEDTPESRGQVLCLAKIPKS